MNDYVAFQNNSIFNLLFLNNLQTNFYVWTLILYIIEIIL